MKEDRRLLNPHCLFSPPKRVFKAINSKTNVIYNHKKALIDNVKSQVENYVSNGVEDTDYNIIVDSVDKKNQLDVIFCILYFSSNSCSTCFGQPCAHHQELTTA